MKESKLIALLQPIQPEELRWLAKWVRSPYYNSNPLVVALFDHLRKYAPAFDSPKLIREDVFKHLFPDAAYDGRRLQLLMFRPTEGVHHLLMPVDQAP